jgi:M6 family metalloprotease-like protein
VRLFYAFFTLLLLQTQLTGQDLNLLGIRVEFVEDESDLTTGNGKFDLSSSSAAFQIDPPPHNRDYFNSHVIAVGDYFANVSNGRVQIGGSIYPSTQNGAYQLPEQMAYYNPNLGDERTNRGLAELFRDALYAAADDAEIDFNNHNCVVIFHAGVGRDIAFAFDETPEDIPSIYISPAFLNKYLGVEAIELRSGQVRIDRGIILPETESQAGIQLAMNGIFANNIAAFLGLPDLFNVATGEPGVGSFGLMDAGLFNFSGLLPARPMAWTRVFAGWEEVVDLTPAAPREYAISARSEAPPVYRLAFSQTESFWLEHRWNGNLDHDSLWIEASRDRDTLMTLREYLETFHGDEVTFDQQTGVLVAAENYDLGLFGSGILIWRVDENVINAGIDSNRINIDPAFAGVSLIEADGAQDMGIDGYVGYSFDMWHRDNDSPLFSNEFSSQSLPASQSQYNRANSGIKLSGFSQRAETMAFTLENEYIVAGFPRQLPAQTLALPTETHVFMLAPDSLYIFGSGIREYQVVRPHRLGDVELTKTLALNDDYSYAMFADISTIWCTGVISQNGDASFLAQEFEFNDDLQQIDMLVDDREQLRLMARTVDSLFLYSGALAGPLELAEKRLLGEAFQAYFEASDPGRLIVFSEEDVGLPLDSLWQPLFNSPDEWIFSSYSGQVVRIRSNKTEIGRWQMDIRPQTQPILIEEYLAQQNQPILLSASGDWLYAFYLNGEVAENYPLFLEAAGPLGSDEVISAADEFGDVFLLRNRQGALAAVQVNSGYRQEYTLRFEGENAVWIDPLGLQSLDEDGVWSAYANGLQPGQWNVPGGGGQMYHTAITFTSTAPARRLTTTEAIFNWPNPNTDNYTNIRVRLDREARISIRIVDLAGDAVHSSVVNGKAGINDYRWQLDDVSSGIYLANVLVEGSGETVTKLLKILVQK